MTKWFILGSTIFSILLISGIIVILHYNKEAYAENKIDAYIAKQGIPKYKIYDEKFVWDWSKSGDYVKNFTSKGMILLFCINIFSRRKGARYCFDRIHRQRIILM
ncbi:DUF3139 domain-containing protein [Listeria newyorkensis]|uniref:DUF3139 domain-containing protein n=1 Tax=Listeria newyorkensis TaxID=1497681 RepID=A0A841YSA8_9LIST|nr:DUF3139 domain-containing protein [Listeria newyorkensis]MBC1456571.1 DUF3139 domain-containing protein [Listeria newyorkensis]